MSETTTEESKETYKHTTEFGSWHRIVVIDIYDTQGDASMGEQDWGDPVYTLDGEELDISFSSSGGSDGNGNEATVTLKNLNAETQWGIKVFMGISITAGYEGTGNSGLVSIGIISNIKDSYDDNGTVNIELTIAQAYNYKAKPIKREDCYPIGTPFKTIIEDVCAEAGFPLDVCAIDGDEYVTTREEPFNGTAITIVNRLVDMANAIRVQNGEITEADKNAGKCFKCTTDAFHLRITDYNKETENLIAFEYSAENGLISIERADVVAYKTSSEESVVTNAEIAFNWRIRCDQLIYIKSKRQPHLDGMYRVIKYTMDGSSRDGDHKVSMEMIYAGGDEEARVENLQNMYIMNYEEGPTSD